MDKFNGTGRTLFYHGTGRESRRLPSTLYGTRQDGTGKDIHIITEETEKKSDTLGQDEQERNNAYQGS